MISMWRHIAILFIASMLCACASWEGVIRVGSDPPEPHEPPFAYESMP